MEENNQMQDDRYGAVDVVMMNLAFYYIWGTSIILSMMDKGLNLRDNEPCYAEKVRRLETASHMFVAAIDETFEATKVSNKTIEKLRKIGRDLEKMGDATAKARHLMEGVESQLEIFNEDFASMAGHDFIQLQKDANEFLGMNILYLSQSYRDVAVIDKTFKALGEMLPTPPHKYISSVVNHFKKKSETIR